MLKYMGNDADRAERYLAGDTMVDDDDDDIIEVNGWRCAN